MSDYNPAASVPPPLQGPALPPDWHLICCDEDHGSPSRMADAPNNDDGYQQQRSRSAIAGQVAGNFAWMSCCEDEACVSPPVDHDRQHRQHGYNFTTGQPTQPHATRRDGSPCAYDDNAPNCCDPTPDSVNVKGLAYCAEPECDYQAGARKPDALGHPTRKAPETGIGDCPPDTICCESIHPVPHITPIGRNAQHVGMDGAPMDCTEEGCCDLDEFVCQDHDMVGACVSFPSSTKITLSNGAYGRDTLNCRAHFF